MADSPRLQALRNLSNQLPVANSRIAQQQQAARDLQLQQAVRQAPVQSSNITQTAQQTGAASAAQAGQQMVQQAQQGLQQQGQVAQLGLQEQGLANQATLAGLKSGAREQEMNNVQKLARLSEQAKQEMYDKQMQFQRDEMGRTQFNERQLADYARLSAETNEQYANYAQTAEQLSKRNLQMMEVAFKKASEDLDVRARLAEQKKDQQGMEEIAAIKREMEARMQRERNRAANSAAAWQAGGTIVGAAVGSLGGPAGAMAGASIGGALGGMAANEQQK